MHKTPLPYVFEYASNLKADPKEVFEFHLHPENIGKVNPSWVRILSLVAPGTLTPGARLSLRVLSCGIPQAWEVRVEEVVPFSGTPAKAYLLDVAERGPFPFWRHLHEFWAAPDGTTGLVDRIEFLPPGGPLGWFFLPLIRWMFAKMFRARHEATRKLFEKS